MALDTLIDRHLVTCKPAAAVRDVAQQMESENVGAVLVVEEERPVGIITDRDLVVRGLARRDDFSRIMVSELMTSNPETVRLCDGLFAVVEVMKRSEVRRVPIVDEAGKAVGLVSFGDIFRLLGKEIAALSENLTPERPKIEQAA